MANDSKIQAGQRFVVMGMGVSGRAAVQFLLQQGAQVAVSDAGDFADLTDIDQKIVQQYKLSFEGGGHTESFCSDCDAVFLSPGIPTDIAVVKHLQARGIPVLGELAIAAPYLTETIVAVTGTNGKTTVTALIGELLRHAGKEVFVGGNIGTPILDYLRHGKRVEFLVLELSSFQLEFAGNFRPHIGILLNVTPDHLDRHKSMVAYAAAKMKMFFHQGKNDIAIICDSDPMSQQIKPLLNGQRKFCFGGLDSSCSAQGSGATFTITLDDRKQESYSLEETSLHSYTGLLNSEAAVLAVSLLGCEKRDIERGLKDFTLAAHRLQFVREQNGVRYYNDSKATNTGAVVTALASFKANVILLAGGKEKGEKYTALKESVEEKVKELILLGEAADAIEASLADVVSTKRAKSMVEAVQFAADIAEPGDTVLLAPACASFDMFDNYGQRGDVFMQAVMDLGETSAGKVDR